MTDNLLSDSGLPRIYTATSGLCWKSRLVFEAVMEFSGGRCSPEELRVHAGIPEDVVEPAVAELEAAGIVDRPDGVAVRIVGFEGIVAERLLIHRREFHRRYMAGYRMTGGGKVPRRRRSKKRRASKRRPAGTQPQHGCLSNSCDNQLTPGGSSV